MPNKSELPRLKNGILDVMHPEAKYAALMQLNASTCPLLRLPAEIRNRIYHHVFSVGEIMTVPFEYTTRVQYLAKSQRLKLGLLYVCRQIYHEAALLPFSLNALLYCYEMGLFARFMYESRQYQRDAVRRLRLKVWTDMNYGDFDESRERTFKPESLPNVEEVVLEFPRENEGRGEYTVFAGYVEALNELVREAWPRAVVRRKWFRFDEGKGEGEEWLSMRVEDGWREENMGNRGPLPGEVYPWVQTGVPDIRYGVYPGTAA